MIGYSLSLYDGLPAGGVVVPADLDGTDISQALVSFLKAYAPVVSVVGTRIFPVIAPQTAARPYLVYRMVQGKGVHHLRGYSGMSTVRIRLTARSRDFIDCTRAREAVRQLDGWFGDFGVIRVIRIFFEDVEDDYEKPPKGSDEGTYEREFDLKIKYREAIPAH